MENNCYLVEVGVLLSKDSPEYNFYLSYDKKNSFYDEGQYYERDFEKAKREALDYVENGVDNTYAVISETFMPLDIDVTDDDVCVEGETYDASDVVYSLKKTEEGLVENFVCK